ncbi:MAG: bifunctional homocysteine S-methyltransferase/methylenetetrahydrofolate reductase [Ignavibacteria bacterium]|nr:bifunctional homocysteine S-methyltransferase/methylenetetrahydrofolate reductase [Ignavibacteria bacterium]MBK6760691.1 bifunctional homocysteine S-methyltransferase/methylenetetrahydrofolate reductase [Ignavibacteria bacterium]MBK7411168.1 bifunctional homocysteine S-methyltransferase/methylenetetrahydrofolate reductase [Ignavibacteria bacterium]MBK7578074.1 bifunctional homocysteine S-methyltransferase/methylenetetrahydrofolate reductase [Ignavibacteria bacterium]MBK9184102.1 bifunctional
MSLTLADRLGLGPIVTDGSMAIELARRGFTERPCDRYNLTSPVVIERIYHDFLDVGSTLLQSNTQNANRYALESSMLSARVHEINRKGVWLARAAAGSRAVVAGVVGPSGRFLRPLGPLEPDDLRACFTEQISALLAATADLIMLKSFIDLDELEIAIDAVRALSKSIPLIALKSFPEDGSVLSGSYPSDVAHRLTRHGVQAIGSNGTVGPQRMLGIVQSLRVSEVPLVAMPDVGIPTIVDGIPLYNAEPSYVAAASRRLVEAGAAIIGADGGADVEHIRAIAEAVSGAVVGNTPVVVKKVKHDDTANHLPPVKTSFHEAFGKRLVTTVELDVPRGLDMSSVIEGARYLKQHGLDAVNISDGARARLRMSPIAISKLVHDATGMECISHLACRDRNMVALQSELLGAHELGVRNILAVTGDPTHIGDFPSATSVYDVDSIGLVRALGRMNTGRDLMGNPLGTPTGFCISCAVNPAAEDMEREIDRLAMKAEQGAHVAFSQPVFDEELLDRFLDRIKGIDINFMLGVIPLRTIRHAEFLHYEVPGMTIPQWVRNRMAEAGDNTDIATGIGIEIAVNFLSRVVDVIDGIYLMPPFKKYDIAVRILSDVQSSQVNRATT